MWKNPVLLTGLGLTLFVAVWGVVDTQGLSRVAQYEVQTAFWSRGWFIMVLTSAIAIMALFLVISPYGRLKLGQDDDKPEFSTVSWFTMMFAAGMGVGLLYWGAAEPLSHFLEAKTRFSEGEAARTALFITNFHWGIHAWAIFGMTGLVLAYFGFRRGAPQVLSAPLKLVFGNHRLLRITGGVIDVLSIYAVAIGVAGSIGLGIFQVRDGVQTMLDLDGAGVILTGSIFIVLCISFLIPLTVNLSKGMALLSNIAMAIAIALALFILLMGPTAFLLSGSVDAFGLYLNDFFQQSFRTFSFFDVGTQEWFQNWTLTYMLWWISWAPFVGVFIARISRGRTIREFLLIVIVGPTLFSVLWFGIVGGFGFYEVLHGQGSGEILDVVTNHVDRTTFVLLDSLPLSMLTHSGVIVSAFLFIVTSVVSASLVLAMFTANGETSPRTWLKLAWGGILAALGLVMILVGDVIAIRTIISMAALPFVFILPLLFVCLFKSLKKEALA